MCLSVIKYNFVQKSKKSLNLKVADVKGQYLKETCVNYFLYVFKNHKYNKTSIIQANSGWLNIELQKPGIHGEIGKIKNEVIILMLYLTLF